MVRASPIGLFGVGYILCRVLTLNLNIDNKINIQFGIIIT